MKVVSWKATKSTESRVFWSFGALHQFEDERCKLPLSLMKTARHVSVSLFPWLVVTALYIKSCVYCIARRRIMRSIFCRNTHGALSCRCRISFRDIEANSVKLTVATSRHSNNTCRTDCFLSLHRRHPVIED
ncbi:hypothetical protein PoB_005145200 [Plakobranchus ocellatus]|uniref:Uncharacterized protein n=1 Tax=Plakobranchus ocellatus TaxID=259542 RepID=A0AAV4C105_9GAST|nr:hypothetical protein PoB_005145200 [Plakobranchus ocellatus]